MSDANMRVFSTVDTGSPWTNLCGLARTLLALCTLTALLGHSAEELFFHLPNQAELMHDSPIGQFSLFYLLRDYPDLAVWIAIGILLVVILGWRPRYTGVCHWYVAASFAASCLLVQGGDQVVANLTLLLLPVTLLDDRKNHWHRPEESSSASENDYRKLVANSCFIVARIQVAVIYFFAGVSKLNVTEWANGTALYYWALHPIFGAPDWLRVLIEPILVLSAPVLFLTWGAILFEVLLAACLLAKEKYKPIMLVLGVLFHFGIWLIHGLFAFMLAMIGALLLYLVKPSMHINFRPLVSLPQLSYLKPLVFQRDRAISVKS